MIKKILMVLTAAVVVIGVSGYATYKYQNREHGPNLYEYYLSQDTVPEGKTGVFMVGLGTTEDFDPSWWHNIFDHVMHVRVPWPFRISAMADRGVALLDPNKYYALERFEPTSLVDRYGSDRDIDGTPYIDRYRAGEVIWVEPMKSRHLSPGHWEYTGRPDGLPTGAARTANSARLWYYENGTKQKKIPHEYQARRVRELAFSQLAENYPDVPYIYADTMDPFLWRKKLNAMLDEGVETLVLASPMVMYSDYEDFKNGFLHTWEMIEEWEAEHQRPIKVVIAPPMGYFKSIRDGLILRMRDKLDTLPAGSDVKMVWSIHGMPWASFPNESWLKMAPKYRDVLAEESRQVLEEEYDFGRIEVAVSQDHFADHYWNPDGVWLSTNKAFLDGVEDDYDYVINLPIEFYTENTDTMFTHAMANFETFPGYSPTDQIDYPDWDEPYVNNFVIDGTELSYNGVLTGDRYRPYVAGALYASFDSVLSQHSSAGQLQAASTSKKEE